MSKNRILNRAHQKAWYSRVRNDPARWQAFLEKRRVYKQVRRNSSKTFVTSGGQALCRLAKEQHAEAITWAWLRNAIAAGLTP